MNKRQLNRMLKAVSRSKTIIFSFILTIFGMLQTQLDQIRVLIDDPKDFALFCIVVSTVIATLRFITTTSILDKVKEEEEGNISDASKFEKN